MAETNETQRDLRLLSALLKPSYLSGTIAGLLTLIIVGSASLTRAYWSSGWLADILRTIANSDNRIFQNSTGSGDSPFNAVLLLLFWAFVGLMAYYMVIGVVRAGHEAHELEAELNYVHTNRRAVLHDFAQRLLTRLLGLVLLFIAVSLYLKDLLPYTINTVRTISFGIWPILTVTFAIVGMLLMTHIMTVLLRLIALRPRLFTSEI